MKPDLIERLRQSALIAKAGCTWTGNGWMHTATPPELLEEAADALSAYVHSGWIPLRDRAPEGDGDVLVSHMVYMGDIVIRPKSTLRLFASDPSDQTMMDAHWMPLPPAHTCENGSAS